MSHQWTSSGRSGFEPLVACEGRRVARGQRDRGYGRQEIGRGRTGRRLCGPLDRMLRRLWACGEVQELPLHPFDAGKVCPDVVIAAALACGQSEHALGDGLGRTCAAQVNYGGKLLPVLRVKLGVWARRSLRIRWRAALLRSLSISAG
jgi:hypothetical protein